MKKITYFYVYVYLLIIKKKNITRNSSLICSSTIEGKKKSITPEFCVYKELELKFTKLEFHVTFFY